jgi:hypothetical protein
LKFSNRKMGRAPAFPFGFRSTNLNLLATSALNVHIIAGLAAPGKPQIRRNHQHGNQETEATQKARAHEASPPQVSEVFGDKNTIKGSAPSPPRRRIPGKTGMRADLREQKREGAKAPSLFCSSRIPRSANFTGKNKTSLN